MIRQPHLWAFACALSFCASQAVACVAPPNEFTKHHTELIERTSTIILARVGGPSEISHKIEKHRKLAQFETIEALKGEMPTSFTIPNGLFVSGQPVPAQDFDGHTGLAFWEKLATRQWNTTYCMMLPYFLQDRTYLLFLDIPHWRGYEEIVADDDLWLGAVKRLIRNPDLDTGLTLTAQEWLSMAHGAFLGEVSDCLGPTLTVKDAYSGTFDETWSYTDNQHARYWPFEDCIVGASYLVVTMEDDQSIQPRHRSIIFEVSNDRVDLAKRRYSELKIMPNSMSLDGIKNALR